MDAWTLAIRNLTERQPYHPALDDDIAGLSAYRQAHAAQEEAIVQLLRKEGRRRTGQLASAFGVSRKAIQRRLDALFRTRRVARFVVTTRKKPPAQEHAWEASA